MIFLLLIALAVIWSPPLLRRRLVERQIDPGNVDQAIVLDLAAAALAAGVSIPRMLESVDIALADARVGGETGERNLTQVARLLLMGAGWDEAWWGVCPGLLRIGKAIEPAWDDGAAPVPLLERSAQTLRATRQSQAKEAAEKLGARLALPLGLCFLPAFVAIGVVPVVAAAAMELF